MKKPVAGEMLYSGPPLLNHECFGMIVSVDNHVYTVEWYVWENGKQTIGISYYSLRTINKFKTFYENLKQQIHTGNKNRSSRNGKAIR